MEDSRFPKLIVFDLDYTLWDFWINTHVEPPLRLDPLTGVVYDSAYEPKRVEFYEDVPDILRGLKSNPDVTVAVASRTTAITLSRSALQGKHGQCSLTTQLSAREALRLIKIPGSSAGKNTTNTPDNHLGFETLPAKNFFDRLEIYPGSKIAHFEQLRKVTGIPYDEMLFFDDELRNQEVQRQLGVTFILVRNGMNWDCILRGLMEWRKRHSAEASPSI